MKKLQTRMLPTEPSKGGITERDSLHAVASGLVMRSGIDLPSHLQELGERYSKMPLMDVCRMAIQLDRKECPTDSRDVIRQATSGESLTQIFTTIADAAMLDAYSEEYDSTDGWVAERDVSSYKTIFPIAVNNPDEMEKVDSGGESPNTHLIDNAEGYKIARYGRKFCVDDRDIMDDRVDALIDVPSFFGEASKRLRPSLVYSILLANQKLKTDGIALFDAATHGNLITGEGSVLSADAIQQAITGIGNQQLNDIPLNLRARYLIIPHDIKIAAETLLASIQRLIALQSGNAADPALQETIQLRSDSRISSGAGVIDPDSGEKYVGNPGNWFMVTRPGRTIEVAYLRGTNRGPVIRSGRSGQGQYGMWFDCNMSIGAKAMDYRGLFSGRGT